MRRICFVVGIGSIILLHYNMVKEATSNFVQMYVANISTNARIIPEKSD